MSATAAFADRRSFGVVDAQMSQLSAQSLLADQRPAVGKHLVADSRADRDDAEVILARSQIAITGCRDVVQDPDARVGPAARDVLAQRIRGGQTGAPEGGGSENVSGRIDRPCEGDVDFPHRLLLDELVAQPAHQREKPVAQSVERRLRQVEMIRCRGSGRPDDLRMTGIVEADSRRRSTNIENESRHPPRRPSRPARECEQEGQAAQAATSASIDAYISRLSLSSFLIGIVWRAALDFTPSRRAGTGLHAAGASPCRRSFANSRAGPPMASSPVAALIMAGGRSERMRAGGSGRHKGLRTVLG